MSDSKSEGKVIDVTAILETVSGQIEVVSNTFKEQKQIAIDAGKPNAAKLFDDLLAIVDNMGVCWYALDLANRELGNAPEIAKGGGYLDVNNSPLSKKYVEQWESKIRPGDNIKTYSARELLGTVESQRNFECESGSGDLDFAIAEVVKQGGDPFSVIMPQIKKAQEEAESVIAATQYKTIEDFHGEKSAFVTAALSFQHAMNIQLDTPDIIKRLSVKP